MRRNRVFLLFTLVVFGCLSAGAAGIGEMRGFLADPTLDGVVDVRDVQAGVSQALGASAPVPEADINKDAGIDVRDVQLLVDSALQDGGVYQPVKGTIQAERLDGLRLVAVSNDGLTVEAPVDPVTGEFMLSLRAKTAWTMSLLDGETNTMVSVFHFPIGGTTSGTLPVTNISDGTVWDLGTIQVGEEGVVDVPVNLLDAIDFSQPGSSEGGAPGVGIYIGEIPGVPATVDRVFAYLIDQLARNTAWAIYGKETGPGEVVINADPETVVLLIPLSGRFGYSLEGPYGFTGSLTKEAITDADWCLEGDFNLPTAGFAVSEPVVRVAESYPEQVFVTITVTPPAPDSVVAQVITQVPVTAVITASNEAVFTIEIVTDPDSKPIDDDPIVVPPDDPAPPTPDPASIVMDLLARDPDADGIVTFDEAKTLMPELTDEMFKRLDANGDGVLTEHDIYVWLPPIDPGPTPLPDPLSMLMALLSMDPDGDGSVTFDEAKTLMPELDFDTFRSLDANSDGVLTRDDVVGPIEPPMPDLPAYLSEEAVVDLVEAIVACANANGSLDSPVEYDLTDADLNGVPDMFQPTVDCLFTVLPDWCAKYDVPNLEDADANGKPDIVERSAADAVAGSVWLLTDFGLLGCEDVDGDGLPDCVWPYVTDAGTVNAMDSDGNGLPDWAEDDNGDGIPNMKDPIFVSVGDLDRDGIPDAEDSDADGDGVPNYCDAAPLDSQNTEVSVPPSVANDGQAANSAA
ncbi:MAG: hypothetical protein V2B18_16960 [Pseudomonadota bacterium]